MGAAAWFAAARCYWLVVGFKGLFWSPGAWFDWDSVLDCGRGGKVMGVGRIFFEGGDAFYRFLNETYRFYNERNRISVQMLLSDCFGLSLR